LVCWIRTAVCLTSVLIAAQVVAAAIEEISGHRAGHRVPFNAGGFLIGLVLALIVALLWWIARWLSRATYERAKKLGSANWAPGRIDSSQVLHGQRLG
jgi:hypothetical protein